jgi:hypothetical protein
VSSQITKKKLWHNVWKKFPLWIIM